MRGLVESVVVSEGLSDFLEEDAGGREEDC